MRKWIFALIPVMAIGMCGCNSGDVPVQETKNTTAAPATDSAKGGINDANIPDAAKKAIAGQK